MGRASSDKRAMRREMRKICDELCEKHEAAAVVLIVIAPPGGHIQVAARTDAGAEFGKLLSKEISAACRG